MKKVLALVLVLALAVSLVACGGAAPAPSEPAASGAASGEAAAGNTNGIYMGTPDADTVTINISSEPPEMNSVTTTDATAINVMRHVYEGLTALDPNNDPVPGVAESWETSEDGLVWTFHLREDSVWSNGEPVTANDFVFAITRHFTPEAGAPYAGTWAAYIAGAADLLSGNAGPEALGVKAVDEHTLEITLNAPCAYFLNLMSFPSFYPINEKFYTEVGMEDGYALDADKMLYNGPYTMASWEHEAEIVLQKNENYWDKANKAFIPTVKMKMIADSGAAMTAFEAGELDMVGLNGEQVEYMKGQGITPAQYADGTPAYVEFNTVTGSPILANAKVRVALTMAIDAQSYITNVAKSSYLPADGMTPPVVGGGKYTDARGPLIERTDDYAAVKAMFEEGCAEVGVAPADVKLNYVTDDGDNAYKMAAFIQNQWKDHLGLTEEQVIINAMPFKSRLQAMQDKTFDVCLALWGPDYDDAMTYLDMFMTDNGNNHTGWSNAEYDKMITDAYAEGDPAKHQEIMINAEKLLMQEMPIGPIYFRVRDYVCSDKFSGEVRTAFQDAVMTYATLN